MEWAAILGKTSWGGLLIAGATGTWVPDTFWLNRVLPFADHHVVHHSISPHDAGNYGNITTVFDQVFATYRPPTPRSCAAVGAWSLAEDYPRAPTASSS